MCSRLRRRLPSGLSHRPRSTPVPCVLTVSGRGCIRLLSCCNEHHGHSRPRAGGWSRRPRPHGAGSRGLSPGRADGRPLPVSPRGRPSVRVCVLVSSSGEDPRWIGLGPTPVAAFSLHPLFKGPSPNTVTFRGAGLWASAPEFGGHSPGHGGRESVAHRAPSLFPGWRVSPTQPLTPAIGSFTEGISLLSCFQKAWSWGLRPPPPGLGERAGGSGGAAPSQRGWGPRGHGSRGGGTGLECCW